MAVQDRLFSLAAKVLRVISLKNVAIWTFAALVALLGYTLFENRKSIIEYLIEGPVTEAPSQITEFAVSDTSKQRVKQLVDIEPLINSIVILNADIRNNRRIPIYWYSDDLSVTRALDINFGDRFGGIPLFTSDEKNNENVVGIINGEFACNTYADGGNSSIYPNLANALPYVCRASLPPYYGQFSGYITITLNRIPSADELATLKITALNIATEIYFRDVLPANKKLPQGS